MPSNVKYDDKDRLARRIYHALHCIVEVSRFASLELASGEAGLMIDRVCGFCGWLADG